MDQSKNVKSESNETFILIGINIIIFLIGILIWKVIWVEKYGITIPEKPIKIKNQETQISCFSKTFSIIYSKLFSIIYEFNRYFLVKTIGIEAYLYLKFQREVIKALIIISLISLIILGLDYLLIHEDIQDTKTYEFMNKLIKNNTYLSDLNTQTLFRLIGLIIYSFFHFRCFRNLKEEAKELYYERYTDMSKSKNNEWLRCRTLHVSGIAPNERNTNHLKRKLDVFLQKCGGGKVVDINFIPSYINLLDLEINRLEINFFKELISQNEENFERKYLFPSVYKSELSIKNEICSIDKEIAKQLEYPIYSSGHAFVTFDSLVSTYACLLAFSEDTFKKIHISVNSMFSEFGKSKAEKERYLVKSNSTFGKFVDEDLELEIMDHEKVDLLVDQMIEPYDIIWSNIGGGRGLFICRRIMLTLLTIFILLFLSTPAAFLSSLESVKIFNFIDFSWIYETSVGKFLIMNIPPLVVLMFNQLLIIAIDFSAYFEKHYTHSRCQFSIFTKAFFYLILNMLIIPGLTMATAESIYHIFTTKNYNLALIFGNLYKVDSGLFFIHLVIQNGTLSSVFYLARMGEVISNKFSTFIAYHKRRFFNSGKSFLKFEKDIFQFGYFYAQNLAVYCIIIVFSSTVKFIALTGVYFFLARHVIDSNSLLTVHKEEMDSSGELVNSIVKYSNVPVIMFQLSMCSFFIVQGGYISAIITGIVLLISLVYIAANYSNYLVDIFNLQDKMQDLEHINSRISIKDISKWRNMFQHPLVLPNLIDEDTK